MTTVVIIPTLDEIDGFKKIMPQVKKEWAEEWLVVDGGSTDGTIEEAKKQGFDVIIQKRKGLGNALLEGVSYSKSENILFFSPDGNAEIHEIPRLIKKLNEGYDMVHISRFGKNSINEDAGLGTSFGNKLFTFLINKLFGGNYTDVCNGFRIIKRDKLESLKLNTNFYACYDAQACIRALKNDLRILELVGNEPSRVGGERKLKLLPAGIAITKLIIKEYFSRN